MDVILLEKVQNLGDLGEVVVVKPGYGRNYLLPNRKAVPATKENREYFEARRAELEKTAAEALSQAQTRKEQIDGNTVTVTAKTGDEGKLFGSVGPADIVDALAGMGITVQKREIRMHEGPIRFIGEHAVEVNLHPEVSAQLNVKVVAE